MIGQAVFRIVSQIRKDATVLLVEHNARMGFAFADHGLVLEAGRILLGGKPDEWSGTTPSPRLVLAGRPRSMLDKTHA